MKEITAKMDDVHKTLHSSFFAEGSSTDARAGISGVVLVQTIQRILDENENLRKEAMTSTAKIDKLRYPPKSSSNSLI